MLIEVVGPAAKKKINAAAGVGFQKSPASGLFEGISCSGRRRGDAGIIERGGDLGRPGFSTRGPDPFKRSQVFPSEVTRDLTRSTGQSPVDANRATGFAFIILGEGDGELVPDGLIVRRNNDHGDVRRSQEVFTRFECKGNSDHHQKRGEHDE